MTEISPKISWEALSLPTIQQNPKKVYLLNNPLDRRIVLTPRQAQDVKTITSLILNGGDLSPYYRRSDVFDKLLKQHQIMHLHLGGHTSNALLYLKQYTEHVLYILIDSHIHLDDIPPGKKLNEFEIKRYEAEKLRLEQEARQEASERIRRSVLSLRNPPKEK